MNKSEPSISFKLFIASALALALTTLLFAGYTISSRTGDLAKNVELMAQTRAAFASNNAELALYTADQLALQQHIEQAMALKGTSGIMFLGRNANPLAASENFQQPQASISQILTQQHVQEDLYYYALPVYLAGIDLFDYQTEFEQNADSQAGWVIVALDISEQRAQLEAIITTTLVIALVAFCAAFSGTVWLNRTIAAPIITLTKTVQEIKEGRLSTRAPSFSTQELSILSSGINRMAEAIQEGTHNLEARVEKATSQLSSTLTDLQQKNDELQAAREDAELANQSKSDFLARMSHELRTPITSIQGFARLLNESSINEADKQHCRVIDQAANQLLMLIDDILDFSKLQSNTVVLENEAFNIIECIEQGAVLFAQSAHEKGLEFIVNFDPHLTLIRQGDQKRIRQIVNNLISNALKFTSAGGVFIRVSEPPSSHGQLEIRVRDTGIGIREANRSQLFRAFSQADTSISRQYGGSGLGLSITKSLVDTMGGTLSFESELNKGTEFIVTIPTPCISGATSGHNFDHNVLVYHESKEAYQAVRNLLSWLGCRTIDAREEPDGLSTDGNIILYYLCPSSHLQANFPQPLLDVRRQHAQSHLIVLTPVTNLHNLLSQDELHQLRPASFIPSPPTLTAVGRVIENALTGSHKAEQEAESPPLLNGLNILIAEDNQFTCLLLETLVEKHGASFSTATNGHEAVKICGNEPFDVILIDVHMPELNGIEAIKQIRAEGVNKLTPIIALTADLLQQEEKELFTAGADEMLLKPFNENHLLEKIRYKAGITTAINQPLAGLDSLVDDQLFIAELYSLAESTRQTLAEQGWQQARDIIHQMLGITGVYNLVELDGLVIQLHETLKREEYQLLPELINEIIGMLNKLSSQQSEESPVN